MNVLLDDELPHGLSPLVDDLCVLVKACEEGIRLRAVDTDAARIEGSPHTHRAYCD